MKCYYHYFNGMRKSWASIIVDNNPLIILDIDINGELMGVEYCG